jgi:hypothetical protein
MWQSLPYIIIILNIIFGIAGLSIWGYFKQIQSLIDRFAKYDHYNAVLQYNMEKAYDIIYKDQILIYSIEATALNEDEFKVVAKNFCVLVSKLIGVTLKTELIKIFGDESTLYFTMTEYFNSRFDEDEIRKTAQDNYINADVDEQGS